jgi:hypothetical protein
MVVFGSVHDSDDRETGSRRSQSKQGQGGWLEGAEQEVNRLLQSLCGRPNVDDTTANPLNGTDQQLAIAIARVYHRAIDISEIDARDCRLQADPP